MKKIFFILVIALSFLKAEKLDLTSFYVAYNSDDPTDYVLVMPMVNKVYTHKAGHILPSDLHDITSQFVSYPTYEDGKLCFSSLNSSATGEYGADIMANNCYDVNFFYIQEKAVSEGYAFLLYYKPLDRVYEGLAGKSDTFKVVRDGDNIYNENSITGTDFKDFYFDIANTTAFTGQDAIDYINSLESSSAINSESSIEPAPAPSSDSSTDLELPPSPPSL